MKTKNLFLLLIIGTFIVNSAVQAQQDYYWVGGTGEWNANPSTNWVDINGNPYLTPPTKLDSVIFNENSFDNPNQKVILEGVFGVHCECNDMDWSGVTNNPELIGIQSLYIYGSLKFVPEMTVDNAQATYFKAADKIVTIETAGHPIPYAVFFDSEGDDGYLHLEDALNVEGPISINKGHLVTNSNPITCYRFNSNPVNTENIRSMDLGSSQITIRLADVTGFNSNYSCNINNESNTLTITSNGGSEFLFLDSNGELSSLKTDKEDSLTALNFPDIVFQGNGKVIAEADSFRDVLFMADGTLEVDGCDFNDVEIYKEGRAYSNDSQYQNLLFSTHPGACDCINNPDCRPVDDGMLEGDNNQVFELLEYNRNGYIVGATNNIDTCRFLANGNVLSGGNEFTQIHMNRHFVSDDCFGSPNFRDTLSLAENHTQTIRDSIVLLSGHFCEHAVITSTSDIASATIKSNAPFDIDYVKLQGITAENVNAPPLIKNNAFRSVDSGNNTNWIIDAYIPLGTEVLTPGVDIICVSPCSYSTNGQVIIPAIGGTEPYTFYKFEAGWQSNGNDSTFTDLSKQQYSFRIEDGYGCIYEFDVDVCGPDPVIIDSVIVIPSPCFNPSDSGQIIVYAQGGTGDLEYSRNNGTSYQVNNPHFVGVGLGLHTVIVRDEFGCISEPVDVVMTQNPQLLLIADPVEVPCHGDSSGIINVSVWGGSPPYYLQIINNGTLETIYDTIPIPYVFPDLITYTVKGGNYTVQILDNLGCLISTNTVVPDVNPPIEYTDIVTAVPGFPTTYCIAIVPSGGAGTPYTYLWDNTGETTASVCDLLPGEHCLTIFDSLGCELETCITIDALTVNLTYDTVCSGQTDTLCANAEGGFPPYQYLWSPNGETTPCIDNVSPGAYSVCVSDGIGTEVCETIEVVNYPEITATFIIDSVTCYGFSDGAITIIPSGGTPFSDGSYEYLWLYNNSTNSTISGLPIGIYEVIVTDSVECQHSFEIEVFQHDSLEITFTTGNANCDHPDSSWVKATVTGGLQPYTYQWQPPGVNGQGTDSIWGVPVGAYTLTVTDILGCDVTDSVTIQEFEITVTYDSVACFGDSTAWAAVTATGGNPPYEYLWTSPNWGSNSTGTSITELWAGDYTISVTDSNGCVVEETITIYQPENPLSFQEFTVDNSGNLCFGDCNDTAWAVPTGGTPPYIYEWFDGTTNDTIEGLCAGTYWLIVRDSEECTTDTVFFDITAPEELILQSYTVTNIDCFSYGDIGQISFDTVTGGTGNYKYSIEGGIPGSFQSDNIFEDLAPGDYTLVVEDENDCKSVPITDSITRPPALSILFDSVVFPPGNGIPDGEITATGVGETPPYTHNWYLSPDIPYLLGQPNPSTISDLYAGVYIDCIVDTNGCVSCDTVVLTQPDSLIITLDSIKHVSCFGGQDGYIQIAITGGTEPYTILWSNESTGYEIENQSAGFYSVVVTDNNQIVATDTFEIIQPDPITVSFESGIACFGDTNGWIIATPSGGTPEYTHSWSNGMPGSYIEGLAPGWYVDTLTDGNDCQVYDSVFISENPEIFVTVTPDTSVCKGASLQLVTEVSGGASDYSYSWTPIEGLSDPTIAEPIASPQIPTTYTLEVIDLNDCKSYESVWIDLDSIPIAEFTFNSLCTGNFVYFDNISEGNGSQIDQWLWDFGDSLTFNGEDPPAHNYGELGWYEVSLTVTSSKGCSNVFTDSVLVAPLPMAYFTFDTVCFGNPTHFTASSLIPETEVSHWLWYMNDGSPDPIRVEAPINTLDYTFSNPGIQNVTLKIVDVNLCSDTVFRRDVFVDSLPRPQFRSEYFCMGDSTNFYDESASGGSTITNWHWDFGDGDVSALQHPRHPYSTPGIYNVSLIITNSNGCEDTLVESIEILPAPIADFTADPVCFGNDTYFIDESIAPGSTIDSLVWSFGDGTFSTQQNPVHSYSEDGDYWVTLEIETIDGCIADTSKFVSVYPLPNVYTVLGGDTICEGDSVEIKLAFSDTTVNYKLLKNGVSLNPVLEGIQDPLSFGWFDQAGTYTIEAENGCPQNMTGSVEIDFFPAFEVDLGDDFSICYTQSPQLNAIPDLGNSADYTYTWGSERGPYYYIPPDSIVTVNSPGRADTLIDFWVTVKEIITGCDVEDTITVHFVICGSIAEFDSKTIINIFPNPATDKVNISVDGFSEDLDILLYSMQSALLKKEEIVFSGQPQKLVSLDISNLPKGVLILQVSGDHTQRLFKIVHH